MGVRINVDGRLGMDTDRLLSPLDRGFVFGASVYETLRTYGGRPFLLARHLVRLRESAASLDIRIDVSDQEIARRLDETLSAAANAESYIRIIASAGVGEFEYRIDSAAPATTVILVKPLPEVPARLYQKGTRLALVDVVRNHPRSVSPRIKSSSLLNNMLAMRQALARGAEEAVMLNYRGEVAEGAQTNIFIVKDQVLMTPSLESGILAGITREMTLSLARELGFKAIETTLLPDQLFQADEVFLTSTTREILPVVQINEAKIGRGVAGPVTLDLLKAYRKKVQTLMAAA